MQMKAPETNLERGGAEWSPFHQSYLSSLPSYKCVFVALLLTQHCFANKTNVNKFVHRVYFIQFLCVLAGITSFGGKELFKLEILKYESQFSSVQFSCSVVSNSL